jgi:hypothetical protein
VDRFALSVIVFASKTGLLRDARKDMNFKHAASMSLKVFILNWFEDGYKNNTEMRDVQYENGT